MGERGGEREEGEREEGEREGAYMGRRLERVRQTRDERSRYSRSMRPRTLLRSPWPDAAAVYTAS